MCANLSPNSKSTIRKVEPCSCFQTIWLTKHLYRFSWMSLTMDMLDIRAHTNKKCNFWILVINHKNQLPKALMFNKQRKQYIQCMDQSKNAHEGCTWQFRLTWSSQTQVFHHSVFSHVCIGYLCPKLKST